MPLSQTNGIGAGQPPTTRIVIFGGLSALAGELQKRIELCAWRVCSSRAERQSSRGMGTNTTAGARRSGSAPRADACRENARACGRLKLRSIAIPSGSGFAPKDVIQNRNDVFHSPPYRDIP